MMNFRYTPEKVTALDEAVARSGSDRATFIREAVDRSVAATRTEAKGSTNPT